MHYYKQNGSKVEKYEVSYNKEKMDCLYNEIIDNCSNIKHEVFLTSFIHAKESLLYRNVSRKEVDENLYELSYDHYLPPYLITLINRLYKGDETAIKEIIDMPKVIATTIQFVKRKNTEIDSLMEEKNIEAINNKLDEIRLVIRNSKENIEDTKLLEYYKQIKNLIEFKLIESKNIKDIEDVYNFLDNGKNFIR